MLIRDIHNATQDKELLITVDQEGGRVQRFEDFSSLEAPGIVGNIINEHGFSKTTLLKQQRRRIPWNNNCKRVSSCGR